MYKEDTIAAIATPPGEGSVAIVRVSGVDAETIAAKIFHRSHGNGSKLQSHRLYHGTIRDPKSACALDEVLLAIMRRPHSYSGEDVVEVQCHGGAFVARRILELILSEGARQAEPGEFTRRAFLNGRLDLAQAEAVLDLIRARTDKSAALALSQTHGAISHWVDGLREELIDILVQVEAAIDFPDEEIELLQRRDLAGKIMALCEKIALISMTYNWGKIYREGVRVCICGRPNVGKSSLLNALLGEQRVIVTPIAGTTRDIIEETIDLNGLPVVLCDTAGIRETHDQIERLGVDLARSHVENADGVLMVIDGSAPLSDDDECVLRSAKREEALIVINKSDLPQALDERDLAGFGCAERLCRVSAKTGAGIFELKESLRALMLNAEVEAPVVITNLRHRSALRRSEQALKRACNSLTDGFASELIAVDLHAAREALEEITGLINNDDILDKIFANFCIGK